MPRLAQTVHLGMAATSAAPSPDGGTLVVTHADDDRATILHILDGRAEVAGRMRSRISCRSMLNGFTVGFSAPPASMFRHFEPAAV